MFIKIQNLGNTAACFAALAILVTTASTAIPNHPTAAATASPVKTASWPKNFELIYCWGATDYNDIGPWCPCAELTLHRRPKEVDVYDCATGNTYLAVGSWSKTRRWAEVTFEFNGMVIYHGTKQPDGTYRGTMVSANGNTGIWEGEFTP